MKKNKLVSIICTTFADLVAGDENYNDYYSLNEALRMVQQMPCEDIEQDDITGLLNPHLDIIAENWKDYE